MCGIAGIVGQAIESEVLAGMARVMDHRGPDAAGVAVWAEGGLAHCRLSILDTTAEANQPFWDARQQACIAFNGEIYNFRELRQQLECHGWRFRTTSDTEVLLLGYLHWGEAVVSKLNGMFAFAIWDERR